MKKSSVSTRASAGISLAAMIAALALPGTAAAQDTATSEAAAAAGEEEDGLEEIVVTAEFREANIQDTPLAITAVNAAMLEARNQDNIQQVANQAPNVTLKSAGASFGPSLIGFIRGVGQTDFNPALEPGVGLYVDDVYYSTLTGSVLDLLDLERVEILRGPQGTLAGRNSIGGSIKLYTKKPTGSGGYIEAGYGNYNQMVLRGSFDFTLQPDQLFARVAGVYRNRDGYVKRLDFGCTHPGSGVPVYATGGGDCKLGTEGGIEYGAVRGSLRWVPTDAVEVNISGDYTNDDSEVPGNTLRDVGQTLLPVGIDTDNNPNTGIASGLVFFPPFLWSQTGYDILWNAQPNNPMSACVFIPYGSNSCDPNKPNNPYVNYATYLDPRQAGAPGSQGGTASGFTPLALEPKQTLKAWGVQFQLDWDISDIVHLVSVSAYRHYVAVFTDDADATPLPVQLLQQRLKHSQRSQEIRLSAQPFGDLLDVTVGGFYFDQDTAEDARVDIPYAALDFIHGPDKVPASTWALFAHGIFRFTDQLELAVGGRYTHEKKVYHYARTNPDGTATCPNGPPDYNCALIGLDGKFGEFKDNRFDWRAALTYHWTDDIMTYAQFATGFKGGGINPRPFYPQQVLSFGPETLKSYELGFKSQLFDRKMRLNGAVFINKYKDIQLGLSDCSAFTGPPGNPFGSPCILPANVGDATMKGIEFETDIRPLEGLQIDGSISYLHFNYTDIDPLTGVPEDGISPFTPKWKWSAGIQYEIPLGDAGTLTPRVDASYQSTIFANATNTEAARIDSYHLVNGRITWRNADEDMQIALEVNNLFDKLYYETAFDIIGAFGGFASAQPAVPRTWMVTAKYKFR